MDEASPELDKVLDLILDITNSYATSVFLESCPWRDKREAIYYNSAFFGDWVFTNEIDLPP